MSTVLRFKRALWARLLAALPRRSGQASITALIWLLAIPAAVAFAGYCWNYAGLSATNPQPWHTANPEDACATTNYLHGEGDTAGQTIGEEHRNWHCINDEAFTREYGRAFLAFHRQFIQDFDNFRLANTPLDRLEYWDPYQGVPVPGDDETTSTPFTECSVMGAVRPAGAICEDCDNLPSAFIGDNLASFDSLGDVGRNLELGPGFWHGSYHNGVRVLGCPDIGGFIYTPRDPAFWMAHKKLDEIARDWQSLQATDVVIVIDRSGSMDDNCSSPTPPPGESPCAINDAREAARTFANLVVDVRMDGAAPAAQQHRIGLASFASTASPDLNLTPANGIITDDGMDNTAFELALAGISTGGNTSIAAGIRQGLSILSAVPDPNPQQAILVLTDGKENTSPCLGGNSPSACTPAGPGDTLTVAEVGDTLVIAVGFGAGAQEANLRDVAERHGGIFVAETNVANPTALQKFFVTAFGEIFDGVISLDPTGTIFPGQLETKPFPIEIVDETRLSVALGYEESGQGRECQLALELFTPSGDRVDPNAEGVEAGGGLRHDFIHVTLPYREQSAGTWMGRIVRPPESSGDCEPQDYFYSVLVKGIGRVTPFVARPNVVVGRPILATFRMSESSRPVGGFDNVDAQVILTRPDGTIETHKLYDDGTHGDKLANNHIWSVEIPGPAALPGVFHLLGHFEISYKGSVITREAEYSIVAQREPDQCTNGTSTGVVNDFVWHRPEAGDTVLVDELACVWNMCGTSDQYEVQVVDRRGWLKTVDPRSGALVDLPASFTSGKVEPFAEQCFGPGPEEGNDGGTIPIFAVIPESADVGDVSDISIRINSLSHPEQASVALSASVVVFPPPDCNSNGRDDAADIEMGSSEDVNQNTVPDECELEHEFHGFHELFLPVIREASTR